MDGRDAPKKYSAKSNFSAGNHTKFNRPQANINTMQPLSSKILHRTRLMFNQADDLWTNYVDYKMSRNTAKRLRKKAIAINGRAIVDRRLLSKIKQYSRHAFGSRSYWPWLAFYTELRGEFKEGWIPDDYYRFELLPRINPEKFVRFSEAKIIDHKLFNGSIVQPLIFRLNGQYYTKDGHLKTKVEVQDLLSELNREIIIKPEDGCGGQNIQFNHSNNLCVDDLPKGSNLLFQKVVTQHPELSKLYPRSINTFRVLSYLNKEDEVEVKYIILRFGKGVIRVDNSSAGGAHIFIHPDGRPEPIGYDNYGFPIGTRHPDTGTMFADLELPFLPKIITFCQKAHRNFPYTRMIGWDVFIDENEEPKLIEWNANNPGLGIDEARFGPFFTDLINPY
jgi:hypothetical protein